MADDYLGAVLSQNDEALHLCVGLREAILVSVELRLRRRIPAALGFDDDVKFGSRELDIGEPTICLTVLL
jgi:hypothetical protein